MMGMTIYYEMTFYDGDDILSWEQHFIIGMTFRVLEARLLLNLAEVKKITLADYCRQSKGKYTCSFF